MAKTKTPKWENLGEMFQQIGDVPPERIYLGAPPGTATEKDVIAAEALPRKRLCELVDGVLIEKTYDLRDSVLTVAIASRVGNFVHETDLGVILGPDGMLCVLPGIVRIPDVSFISWDRIPGSAFPDDPIAKLVPNLAIEVINPSNTRGEMFRKLEDYFLSGVELVWLIYPKTQMAEVYTGPDGMTKIAKNGSLDGGAVLPGFTLSLKELFSVLHRRKAV